MESSYALPRVLVVDDEAMVRQALARALTEAGYPVRQAAPGLAALDLLRDEPPEVLLTDLHMSGMTGAELIVSACALLPDIGAKAMSGDRYGEEALEAAGLASAVIMLAKAFTMADLLDRLGRDELLRRRDRA